MYDEPYRWVEAIRNRRDYLEEQLSAGSPIVGLPYQNGILLVTVGTGKLYEIYDQIAFGGMGHPADLEKLRNIVLDMAHVEGFNRSPVDVTVQRLMKFGLAPTVKQGFEEVLHAPYIAKIAMAEIHLLTGKPLFFRLNYDGVYDERAKNLVLAGSTSLLRRMEAFLDALGETASFSLQQAMQAALRTWAISESKPEPPPDPERKEPPPEADRLDALLKDTLKTHSVEGALLDRTQPGSSKYRSLSQEEIRGLLEWLE